MQTRAESAEVFYPTEDPVVVGAALIDTLKQAALASPRKRARLCTHASPAHSLHEMLIVLQRGTYIRPHRHLGRIESFTILEGEADVVLYHEAGSILRVIPMGPSGSGKTFYYRLDEPVYHTLVLRSETLVFHEVTQGPFFPDQTQYASWASETAGATAATALN